MEKLSPSEAGKLGYVASGLAGKNKAKHLRHVEQYSKNPKSCHCCSKSLGYESRRNKFCSHSCSASYSNKKRGFKKRVRVPCINCGGPPKKHASKFCSNRCQCDYQWKLKKKTIEEKGVFNGVNQAKRYLKETRPNCCAMCGIDTWVGKPIMLVCDHINGNPEDWSLDNFRLICSNCDATTPFYKNRNMGNGRHKRRERYHSGKSY